MVHLSGFAKNRLKSINWFNCVNQEYNVAFYRVVDFDEFIHSIQSHEWEDSTLEARNEITSFLAIKHSALYQNWNGLVKEASDFVDNVIISSVKDIAGADMDIIYINMKWDLVNYLIEDAYKEKLKKPLFFNELVFVYERGHIPCGWDGVWPNGNLVIY